MSPLSIPSSRLVTLRGLVAGLIGVILICAVTPYNNYVIGNTYMVGGTLPIGLLLYLMALLLLNAPLHRWLPSKALRPADLLVATVMVLVACALPGPGLMQYLPAPLVGLLQQSEVNYTYRQLLESLNLPPWLFPTTAGQNLVQKASDPVIRYFYTRTPLQEGFGASKWAVPWLAWLLPAATWGLLIGAISGMILCLASLLHEQWVHNERLPFPIASIYVALIDPPQKGRVFNPLLRSRLFWIAAGCVFALHSFNVLAVYFPKYVPSIPLSYNFYGIFSQPPFSFTDWAFKTSKIYFMVVGLTFFLPGRIALSLWLGYVVLQIAMMQAGQINSEISEGMQRDQTFGSMVVYTLMIIWLGRLHWRTVGRDMVRRIFPAAGVPDKSSPTETSHHKIPSPGTPGEISPRSGDLKNTPSPGTPGEGKGGGLLIASSPTSFGTSQRFLPNWLAGWGFLLFSGLIVAWLTMAGASLWGALLLVAVFIMFVTLIARIVAETGLAFVQLFFSPTRLWTLLRDWSGGHLAASPRTMFYTAFFDGSLMHDSREPLSVYATHALKTADDVERNRPTRLWGLVVAMVLALVVGYGVSFASTLWMEYHHGITQGVAPIAPINGYGVQLIPADKILQPTQQYLNGAASGTHNAVTHVGIGAAVTGTLAFLTVRYTSWPLHPIGFLVIYSYPLKRMWFSIFLGWALKTVIVHYGGASMFRAAKPFFIGLIIGEAGTAGFWLLMSILLHSLGLTYHPVYFTP